MWRLEDRGSSDLAHSACSHAHTLGRSAPWAWCSAYFFSSLLQLVLFCFYQSTWERGPPVPIGWLLSDALFEQKIFNLATSSVSAGIIADNANRATWYRGYLSCICPLVAIQTPVLPGNIRSTGKVLARGTRFKMSLLSMTWRILVFSQVLAGNERFLFFVYLDRNLH